ncbi:four helix bundle protein [Gillisia hiemivivida]|uniref:Four helix bundle protein n=1 Tax=Gillisia hiemivivida TaxID=291190 RepID=A0A5C6ZUH8_9FLAO|nr:four helix bundle protein [Gillisia hiemivivida]TXD93864.1 four helix bundle protein [Gillisia hiemivivida]
MNHKDLDVWKKGMDLVEEVYKLTANFPSNEMYGLSNQLRRAAVSIPSNIAEGSSRKGDKELLYFINVAIGSIAEIETQMLIAARLKYVDEHNEIFDKITEVRKLLLGFRNYINKKGV